MVKVATLAGRDQLCIHEKVAKEPSAEKKGHICRALVNKQTCHFYNTLDSEYLYFIFWQNKYLFLFFRRQRTCGRNLQARMWRSSHGHWRSHHNCKETQVGIWKKKNIATNVSLCLNIFFFFQALSILSLSPNVLLRWSDSSALHLHSRFEDKRCIPNQASREHSDLWWGTQFGRLF